MKLPIVYIRQCLFKPLLMQKQSYAQKINTQTKLGQLTDVNKGNNFQESFEQFGRLGLSSRSFSTIKMSTIKNGQISLYCHFNEIMKEPGTNFQSPALSQNYVRNVSYSTLLVDQVLF